MGNHVSADLIKMEDLLSGHNKLIIYTGGTFDLFHFGHLNFLKQCARLGRVFVALNTDEFVEAFKGKPPIMNYKERKATLENCSYVECIIKNSDGADSRPTIEKVCPNIIAVGSDWARKDYYRQMGFTQDWLDERGIMLVYIPYTKGVSTTEIKERICSR